MGYTFLACTFCFPNSDQGIWPFFSFHKLSIHAHMHVQKKTFALLWGTITWSETGKQNIQVKKVSCLAYPERTR